MHRHCYRPRTPEQQPDLFPTQQPSAAYAAPGWNSLPDQARQAVTALMLRLLLAHAGGTVRETGSDADER